MQRLIKKYPNRRLYDTQASQYIILSDIRTMVVDGVDFKVVEKHTGEDITRNILLQIIIEQETNDNEPMFGNDMLMELIRSSEQNTQENLRYCMEQGLDFFIKQQKILRESMYKPMKQVMGEANPWLTVSEKQMQAWKEMQQNLLDTFYSSPEKKDAQ